MTYQAQQGQSLYDICLQTYGTFEQLYKLMQDNNIQSIATENLTQKIFQFDKTLIKDVIFFNFLRNNNINLATALSASGKSFNTSFNKSFN